MWKSLWMDFYQVLVKSIQLLYFRNLKTWILVNRIHFAKIIAILVSLENNAGLFNEAMEFVTKLFQYLLVEKPPSEFMQPLF